MTGAVSGNGQRVHGIVPIYSIAKIFAAAAALMSFNEDAPIGSLAAVPPRMAHISVSELLTHRSGLGDYGAWGDYRAAVAAREDAWSPEIVLDRVELHRADDFQYSNVGYLLIRMALEGALDQPFFETLDRLVLSPLELSAFPFATRSDWDRCENSTVPDARAYDPAWVYTGTVAARMADVAHALARLMKGTLGHDLANRMRRTLPLKAPHHPFAQPGYGFGLMTDGYPPAVVGHVGAGPGFTLSVITTSDGDRVHSQAVNAEVDDGLLLREVLAELRPTA